MPSLVKLQCENCFSDVLPVQIGRHSKLSYYQCQGCGVYYFYDGKLVEAPPPWQPEGLVENPQGEWVTHYLYIWKSPVPPYKRYVGFKSANYHKEVELDITEFMFVRGHSLQHVQRMVAHEINKAIKDVIPEGLDPLPLLENLYLQAFRDFPLLSRHS